MFVFAFTAKYVAHICVTIVTESGLGIKIQYFYGTD